MLPYSDFIFVHPPGVIVWLVPFATLAEFSNDIIGMAAARVALAVLGSANAVLVYRLVRPHSRQWAIVAGLLYAVWRVPSVTEHTILLEPFLTFFILLSLLFLVTAPHFHTNRRLLAAGVLLGLALATKLWAGPVVAFILLFLVKRSGLRAALVCAAGLAGSLAAVCLPFFISSPTLFFRQVVSDQLGRSSPDGLLDRFSRFSDIGGFRVINEVGKYIPPLAIAGCVVIIMVACCFLAWRSQWPRLYIGIFIIQCMEIWVAPVYFYHYFAFAAASAVIVAVAAASSITGAHANRATLLVSATVLVTIAAMALYRPVPPYRDYSTLRDLAAEHKCVWFAAASDAVAIDSLSRQLHRGCVMTVDSYGAAMNTGAAVDYNSAPVKRESAFIQRRIAQELRTSDAAVTSKPNQSAFNDENLRYLRDEFVAVYETERLVFWSRA
jgi:4-amino-4-deoxy-L-arabinose transferase-like glycosyltransferase